jgi:hypothetical protein
LIIPSGSFAAGGVHPNSPAPKVPAFVPVVIWKSIRNGAKSSSVEIRNRLSLLQ